MTPPPVPDWLVPWSLWVIRGKVDPRPAAPSVIPEWAIWFPAWVKWRMRGKVGPRPAKAPFFIPRWAFAPEKEVVREVNKEESLEFWRGMGVWVTRIDHFPPVWLDAYGAGEYRYVVVPCLFGVLPEENTDDLDEYVAGARARDFGVVGSQWGAATTVAEAEDEAEAGAAAYRAHGFDAWCINGEKRYEGGGRSSAYAHRFRQRVGFSVPLLWSPEPRISIDHAVLQELGVAYGPQAYPLENGKDVNFVAEWARNFGYLAKNTVPLVQAYQAPDGSRYPAAEYRRQAIENDLPGLILYPGNQAADVPEFWRDLVL